MVSASPQPAAISPPVVVVSSPPLLLWSTNTHLKYRIQKEFFGDKHYVWCSPVFSAAALGRYDIGANQPPSSDPFSIYRELRDAVGRTDSGCAKIISQKKVLRALAVELHGEGKISEAAMKEIVAMVKTADFSDWRPLIYTIPFSPVANRVLSVPRGQRASHEPEYIVRDLDRGEFQIIEMPA